MDIADDWDKQYRIPLYEAAYKAAIDFQNEFPDTLWCWGNHDLSYKWEQIEKGFSPAAIDLVQEMLQKLEAALPMNPRWRLFTGLTTCYLCMAA